MPTTRQGFEGKSLPHSCAATITRQLLEADLIEWNSRPPGYSDGQYAVPAVHCKNRRSIEPWPVGWNSALLIQMYHWSGERGECAWRHQARFQGCCDGESAT